MPEPPAGWYLDGTGDTRWWDGDQWTEQVLLSAEPAAVAAPAPGPEPEAEPEPKIERALARASAHFDSGRVARRPHRRWYGKKRYQLSLALFVMLVAAAALM
jgi:hypothetical protein